MEDIYYSDYFSVEFDKDSECALLVWKKYEAVDNFRTPLMKACDMIRKHQSDVLIIDRTINPNVADKDKKWVSTVFVSALKKSGCKKIIIVGEKKDFDLSSYPYDVLKKKFDSEFAESSDLALASLTPENKMSVKEALDYMGLPHDATPYVIDEKFWQMSKNIRAAGGDDYEAKLDELSEVYDIASGRKISRDKALAARNRKKKYFGKTADEWKTHFSYSWFKYLLILLGVFMAGSLIYNMFIKPRIDCGIVSVGHFACDGKYYEQLLLEEMGFKNAYVNTADVVVPNDEGQMSAAYAEQSADSMLVSKPNILITDSKTTPYYFSACADMTNTYEMLRENLVENKFDKLVPVYLSEREFYYMIMTYEYETGYGEAFTSADLAQYNPEQIMIGIMVEDPEYMGAMGYDCYWLEDDEIRLVFSVYTESINAADSDKILLKIFNDTL